MSPYGFSGNGWRKTFSVWRGRGNDETDFASFVGYAYFSYKTAIPSSQATNINSSYDGKIPATIILIIDESASTIVKDVKPSSYQCGAHKFSIGTNSAFDSSIRLTTEAMFEHVIEQESIPTHDEMIEKGAKGYILVRLTSFEPRIVFIPGFWSASSRADVDIAFDFVVRDVNNKILINSIASATKTAEGEAGGACGNGAQVLSEAIGKATKEAMERYAERVSNSAKVQDGFKETDYHHVASESEKVYRKVSK